MMTHTIAKLKELQQLLGHQSLPRLRQPFRLEGLIDNSCPNIYIHYYDYVDYTKHWLRIQSQVSAKEGLGEHTGGSTTPEHEVFCVRRL
jgi:hypothetical protein